MEHCAASSISPHDSDFLAAWHRYSGLICQFCATKTLADARHALDAARELFAQSGMKPREVEAQMATLRRACASAIRGAA